MGNGPRKTARPVEARALIVHPSAERDLAEALAWCREKFGAEVAARLLRRFATIGNLLAYEPGLGTAGSRGTRQFPLQRYPFTLIYRTDPKAIHVIALRHQRRKPWP